MILSMPPDIIFSAVSLNNTDVTGYPLSNEAIGLRFRASHNFIVLSSDPETRSSGPLLAPEKLDVISIMYRQTRVRNRQSKESIA